LILFLNPQAMPAFFKEFNMNEDLKTKLLGLGLTEEQVNKLAAEGVTSEADLLLLSSDEIKSVTGCGLVVSKKVQATFAPVVAATPLATAAADVAVDPAAEIPEGTRPSAGQVTSFASQLGIDPNVLTLMMVGGNLGGGGMGAMDISGMMPIETIVTGYNPKVRNMFLMVMGTLEERLGTPIVVIDEDGSVNKALTTEYINGLEEGRDSAADGVYFDSSGMPHEIIRVGVDAQSIYDADPCDSTKPLQKNGMGVGRVNWHDVTLEVKQAVFYAVRSGEISPTDENHMTWLRDNIKPTSRRLVLQGRAPKALASWNEAMRTGTLPTLRVMMTRAARRPEFMPRRRSAAPRDLSGIGRDA
jgi:hypothetical protein